MSSDGEITIFYSGQYESDAGKISAQEIAKTMGENGDNIRIIDNTQVAKLIEMEEFKNSAGRAFGFTEPREIDAAFNDRSSPENGLWADVSRCFASETVGEVLTLTVFASQ